MSIKEIKDVSKWGTHSKVGNFSKIPGRYFVDTDNIIKFIQKGQRD